MAKSDYSPPWDTDSYSSALLDANDKIKTLQQQIIYWTDFASKEIEKLEAERDYYRDKYEKLNSLKSS